MITSDRFKAAVEAFVTRITSKYDYCAAYACTVIGQNADGTLEVKPDAPSVPGMTSVPYRTLPGIAVTVPAGSRVLVTFENADPSRPIAQLWELGSAATMTITTTGNLTATVGGAASITATGTASVNGSSVALGGGTVGVARVGDTVTVNVIGVQAGGATVVATGTITAGSTKVKAA